MKIIVLLASTIPFLKGSSFDLVINMGLVGQGSAALERAEALPEVGQILKTKDMLFEVKLIYRYPEGERYKSVFLSLPTDEDNTRLLRKVAAITDKYKGILAALRVVATRATYLEHCILKPFEVLNHSIVVFKAYLESEEHNPSIRFYASDIEIAATEVLGDGEVEKPAVTISFKNAATSENKAKILKSLFEALYEAHNRMAEGYAVLSFNHLEIIIDFPSCDQAHEAFLNDGIVGFRVAEMSREEVQSLPRPWWSIFECGTIESHYHIEI